ncbi:MAG: pitrilysin family protein [Pseudohongiellaceae bacterium]
MRNRINPAYICVLALAGWYSGAGLAQNSAGVPELNLDYDRFTLSNGLTVVVHEDRKTPVVAVSIWYHVGSKNEPTGKTGFAHLFEHIMFNGSENFDGEWFDPMQRVGATGLNGSTWLDRTNYFQTVPTPALDLALWMESDRMGHLLGAVTQEKLDNQRGVVQNEKRQGDNRPYGRAFYNLYEGLFPAGHPYRHSTIGSMDDLNAASLEDVHQWFRDFYGPNNAVLTLAGDIDLATARDKVERFFGDIPAGPNVDTYKAMLPVRDHNTAEVQFDEVPAARLYRAWVLPNRNTRESAMMDLATGILGQGRISRLYMDLVYQNQKASQVNLAVTPFELASTVELMVTMNPGEPVSTAHEAVDRLVGEFIASGPTDEELQRQITTINADIIRGLEEVGGFSGKAVILSEGQLYAGDPLFIEQYLEWINTATIEDVRTVAEIYLAQGWHQVDVLPSGQYSTSTEGVDRSQGLPEIPLESPALRFPAINTGTLSNGIEVILAQRNTIPVVELNLQFDAGYAADAGHKLGVSSFTMAMLENGTANLDSLEIARQEANLGAEISTSSDLDASSVSVSALKSNLAQSIDLWADVIRNPVFEEEEIERLKGRRISGIAQEKAQPSSLIMRLLPQTLYGPGHAYSVPLTGSGTEVSVNSINRDDLMQFRESWLRPDNAKLFIVGDTRLDEIMPFLERAFQGWAAPAVPLPVKNIANVPLPKQPRVILIDKPGSPQSQIAAAHVIPGLGTALDIPIEAMNRVLGQGFTARINMNLREDKGWSYGARINLASAIGPRPLMVDAPVQTDRTGDSLRELDRELRGIQGEQPIQADELERVIAGSTRSLPGNYETSRSVLVSMITSARYGRPLDYAATLTDQYEALELEDLQSAAEEILHPDSLVWMIIGDLAKIREQVEAADIGPVEIWDEDGNRIE